MPHLIELVTRDGRRVRDARTRDLVWRNDDGGTLFGNSDAACLRVSSDSVDVFSDLGVAYPGSNADAVARFRCKPSSKLLEIGGGRMEFKQSAEAAPPQHVGGVPNYWRRTSNLQLLYRQGPVGIGRSDPAERLDVNGWVRSTGSLLVSSGSAELAASGGLFSFSNERIYLAGLGAALGSDAASAYLNGRMSLGHTAIDVRVGSNGIGLASDALRIGCEGSAPRVRVGYFATSPAASLAVQGSLLATGNVTSLSDARAKADVRPLERALERISTVRGYTFEMDGQRRTGLLSQEVSQALPELVQELVHDSMSVTYENAVALAIQAIRELVAKMSSLRERLRSLQNLSMK